MRASVRTLVTFAVGLAAGAAIAVGVGYWRRIHSRAPVATAQVFEHTLSAIRASFVDSLTDEELYVKAAQGVVSTLGDPYSAFLGPEEFRGYRDMLRGRGQTFGLTLESGLTGLRVAHVISGGAADKAGIEPGDFVFAVGGTSVRGWHPARATAALVPDSATSIRIQPPGDSIPSEVPLEPRATRLAAVTPILKLSDSVGYLALRSISDNSAREVRDALADLDAEELAGVVIDLRGNRGGRLDQGLAIADLFLGPGAKIGTVANRRLSRPISTTTPELYPDLKLTLLVDRYTASSAEIIAAALRDNGRASLVGEKTYGKGLIQTTIPLGDSIAVRLTTGRWQGPGGELLAGGLRPDSAVGSSEWTAELKRALVSRTEVVREVLSEIAAAQVAAGVSADSVTLGPEEQDLIRERIRAAGLTLSRRTIARHRQLFDAEVARLVAATTGTAADAVRFSLLTDPVVTAGLVSLFRPVAIPAPAATASR